MTFYISRIEPLAIQFIDKFLTCRTFCSQTFTHANGIAIELVQIIGRPSITDQLDRYNHWKKNLSYIP